MKAIARNLFVISTGILMLGEAKAQFTDFGFGDYKVIKEIESDPCYILPEYSKDEFERVPNTSGFDQIKFEYLYKERKDIVLILEEKWTHNIVERKYQNAKILTETFQISERVGNEFTLDKQVARFVTRKGKFTCKERS